MSEKDEKAEASKQLRKMQSAKKPRLFLIAMKGGRMAQSMFNVDSRFERASVNYLLNKQMDLLEKVGIINVKEVVTDASRQKAGIDVIADVRYKGKLYPDAAIDFKSIAGFIPTFSQEAYNSRSGNIGWIMNPELDTDFYLYVWHDVKEDKGYKYNKIAIAENPDVISKNRLVLLSKADIQRIITEETGIQCMPSGMIELEDQLLSYLGDKYYETSDIKKLMFSSGKIRSYSWASHPQVYLTLSGNIHERPVNFIVRVEKLQLEGQSVCEVARPTFDGSSMPSANRMMGYFNPLMFGNLSYSLGF